jgi:hypothetical protein
MEMAGLWSPLIILIERLVNVPASYIRGFAHTPFAWSGVARVESFGVYA